MRNVGQRHLLHVHVFRRIFVADHYGTRRELCPSSGDAIEFNAEQLRNDAIIAQRVADDGIPGPANFFEQYRQVRARLNLTNHRVEFKFRIDFPANNKQLPAVPKKLDKLAETRWHSLLQSTSQDRLGLPPTRRLPRAYFENGRDS